MDLFGTGLAGTVLLCVTISLFSCIRRRQSDRAVKPEAVDISSFKQHGEWAIVTGCTDGIGKEIAITLHGMGYKIILVSRTEAKLRAMSEELPGSVYVVLDYSEPDFSALEESVADKKIGVLVNNAGAFYTDSDTLDRLSKKEIHNILMTNVLSTTLVMRIVMKRMNQVYREGSKMGLILSISSGSSLFPCPLLSVYAASKAYLNHLMLCLKYEYPQFLFQTLTPFYIATKMSRYAANNTTIPSVKMYIAEAFSNIDGRLKAGYQYHDTGIDVFNGMPEERVGEYMYNTNKVT